MRKGLLITFEGGDGSGKSTQLSLLKEYLIQKGIKILTLREPGGVAISEKIRKIILDNKNTEMSPVTEMLLYAASRAQLVSQVIKPSLEKGITVICDRFVDSSYVYQGLARGLGIDTVKLVNDIATEYILPDITFFMDIAPELALKRRFNAFNSTRCFNNNHITLFQFNIDRIKIIYFSGVTKPDSHNICHIFKPPVFPASIHQFLTDNLYYI
jgi:dTMP kinase